MKKILFVNAPSCFNSYAGTRINAVVQVYPLLSYSILAAVARRAQNSVSVLDLGIILDWKKALIARLDEFRPDFICMTSTTTIFPEVANISFLIRKLVGEEIKLVLGGPHATALPQESLELSAFDVVITGEGENPLMKLIDGVSLKDIPGISYREAGNIQTVGGRDFVKDLDSLPFLAFDLFPLKQYKCSKIIARCYPLVNYMTSRGCPYQCTFCNHNIFGAQIRYKSPHLVVEEIKQILRLGIKEVRIIDDAFTFNMPRAKLICELIIREKLKFLWTLSAGLRVDSFDLEFLKLAKKAGLYQVALGFESGEQTSLDSINKGIAVEQSSKAMELVRKAGLESVGFFMLGLPADTEESMQKTIDLAVKLSPTYGKVAVTIPFPGTSLFTDYEKRGLIKSRNWELYNLHSLQDIYCHPNLDIKTIRRYYNKFYNAFYLRPGYLLASLYRSIRNFSIVDYFSYGVQTFFPKIFKPRLKIR